MTALPAAATLLAPEAALDLMLDLWRGRMAAHLARAEAFGGLFVATPPADQPLLHPQARLMRLACAYDLSQAEATLLLAALAPATDPRFAQVYAALDLPARPWLTPGLAARLIAAEAGAGQVRGMLAPEATLIRHGLLALSGDGPQAERRLSVPDPVVDLLTGPPLPPPGVSVLPLPGQGNPGAPRLIVGPDPLFSPHLAGQVWLVSRARTPDARPALIGAALAGAQVALAGWDDAPEEERRAVIRALGQHAAVLTARPALWQGQGLRWDRRESSAATRRDRLAFWQALAPALADTLADAPEQDPGLLWRLAQEAADPADLAGMIRAARALPMLGLAQPVAVPHGPDDLILSAPAKAHLGAFAARLRTAPIVNEDWGLGAAMAGRPGGLALFTGPSGTGKTMAAGVVARLAGLDLWRVDLACVVSKWLGETEANLDRVFQAAERSRVMLFFDEAEALFSRRAEVKEARDRYANLEMAYLLQRLEQFHGMAVLASNMGGNLDPALTRRFDLVLEFGLPDVAQRLAIWRRAAGLPLARDVDLPALAQRHDLSGGHIRQAVLAAAHAAAARGGRVTQADLTAAVAQEYAKLGRAVRRSGAA